MLYDKILEIILDYIMYIAILYHIIYFTNPLLPRRTNVDGFFTRSLLNLV